MYHITLIPGDGIGPEVADAARRVLDATGVQFYWDIRNAGESQISLYGSPLPDETLTSIENNRIALKGPITTPKGIGFRSVSVELRKKFDLFYLFTFQLPKTSLDSAFFEQLSPALFVSLLNMQ